MDDHTRIKRSSVLSEHAAKAFLAPYGIPVVEEKTAADSEEAVDAARSVGFPVVLKALGDKLLHKTERRLVHLNLADEQMVRSAADAIAAAAGEDLESLLVQPQVSGTREFVAGLFYDDQYGPVIMFGLGGVFVEVLKDVAFRVAPLTEADTRDMIEEIKGAPLLHGMRGEKPKDIEAVKQVLSRLSDIAVNNPEIQEIDLNPVIVHEQGLSIVDSRILIQDQPSG